MEGAHKSVQLHNIGSMCMTALPTQISLPELWEDICLSLIMNLKKLVMYKCVVVHIGKNAAYENRNNEMVYNNNKV